MTILPQWFAGLDIHPAVLAGPAAWYLHGLTSRPPAPGRLRLEIPTDRAAVACTLLGEIHQRLQRCWNPVDIEVRSTRDGLTVSGRGNRTVVSLAVADARLSPNATTFAMVDGTHVPLIDRRAAVVGWLSCPARGTNLTDAIDVGRWAQPLATPRDTSTRRNARDEVRLIRPFPEAVAGLERARRTLAQQPPRSTAGQLLPGLTIATERARPDRALARP